MNHVDFDAIPSELQQRDQWLLWDERADRPKQPHWDGDHSISWSDPDYWHSFGEAKQLAEANEHWGIGYVTALENDDYGLGAIGVIDIDTAYIDDEAADWVPSLEPFADAYAERSPSGEGIHIPFAGSTIPKWWSDSDFSDRCPVCGDVEIEDIAELDTDADYRCTECEMDIDHVGVDILANKFCTFTGNSLQDGDVYQGNIAEWLHDAYKSINGEQPPIAERGSTTRNYDDDLEKEQVSEMLDHVDSGLAYGDWLSVGMAVYDWDDGSRGKRLFENWSKSNPKWDEKRGQLHIDDIWSGSPDGKVSVGTLVHFAKEGGWEPPWAGGDSPEDESIAGLYDSEQALASALEMLAGVLSAAKGDEEPTDDQVKTLRTIAAKLPTSEYEDRRETIAEAIGVNPSQLDEHRTLYKHREQYGKIRVHDGGTYYLMDTDAGLYEQEVLNFELDVDSVLRMNGREVIDARVEQNGSKAEVQFEPRDLQKKQRFKDNVLAGKFGLTFDSGSAYDEPVLNALNQYINYLDAPVRRGTHHIGLHSSGNEWVTPQGTLGADGWTDDPGTIYVEREVALERAFDLPTDTAEYDREDVAEILRSLPKTRDPARMVAVLGWFYSAPLRPHIFDEWGAGAFNHLNITGDTGSGKTTTLRYLWRAFGVESDPFAVTDTKFAMLTALSASNGLPVWYDEYKPSEIQDYRLSQFHDLYRKSATGGTATRGRADQTTEEYHTHAPIVVSGEEQIRRPAERRRSIMVAFREDVTETGTDTRATFKRLVGEGRIENGELELPDDAPDPTHHAVAYYRWIAAQDGADLRAKWQDARELVWERRQEWDETFELDDMEVQGMRTVAFGWMVMRAFAQDHDVSVSDLPDENELDGALRHIASEIGPEGQRKSHMDRFVELLERGAAAGYVERGQQYAFVHEGRSDEELRIHLNRTRDALSKYIRDHGLDTEELLSNAGDYRKRFKEAAESGDSYVVTHSQKTPPLGRCAGISTIAAMNELEFDRQTLGAKKQDSNDINDDSNETVDLDADGSQQDLYRAVMAVIRTRSNGEEGVTSEEILSALADNYDENRINNAIENLKDEGELMEPKLGVLMST